MTRGLRAYEAGFPLSDPSAEVIEAIRTRPPSVNVIATGRDAPEGLIEMADTVTEMRKVKHAYDRGIKGKKGIEY